MTGPARFMKGSHHSFEVFDTIALKPSHARVRALRERGPEPVDFGSRIWRSSYLLIDYLSRQALPRQERLLELGCGWGLPSQYLHKQRGLRVTATDADHRVHEYLALLNEVNDTALPFSCRSFSELGGADLAGVGTLVGADICYTSGIRRDLGTLVDLFLSRGGRQVIVADSGRDSFFDLADQLAPRWPLAVHAVSLTMPAEMRGHVLHIGSA